jgi:arylsulfatase A-like enzyme
MTAARPDILLIMADQLGAWALDEPGLEIPALSALAAQSRVFGNAICPYPVCVPSRTALQYGRYPFEVTHPGTETDMAGPQPGGPPRGVRPGFGGLELGHRLRGAGYDCLWAGKWHVGAWGPSEHLERGADTGFAPISPLDDANLVDRVAGALAGRGPGAAPVFVMASFDNPHNICEWRSDLPLPWGDLPPPPAAHDCPPLPANIHPNPGEPDPVTRLRAGQPVNETGYWRGYRWAYQRLIEKLDAEIGRLLAAWEARPGAGARADVVIFTSDHGEMAGAKGLMNKHVLYRESVEVPLFLRMPGLAPGRSEAPVVNMLDIHATALAIAGVEGDLGRGRPLHDGPERSHAVAMTAFAGCGARLARSRAGSYIVYEKGPRLEEFFDRVHDPHEQVNLATWSGAAARIEAHRAALRDWMAGTGDALVPAHYARPGESLRLPVDSYPDGRGRA